MSAVVARAGGTSELVPQDYGVDLSVRRIDYFDGKMMDMGVAFDCQLKASVNWEKNNGEITYDLEANTYNKIIHRHNNSSSPCLLAILCLPRNETEWLEINPESLIMRECCYYIYLDGIATTNSSTIRIKIPDSQILTPEAVSTFIERSVTGQIT